MGLEQGDGGLGSDALDAGDVVGAVAGEGLEVDHVLGWHSQPGDHLLAADLSGPRAPGVGAATHVEHGDVPFVVDELEQIAIAGEDAHPPALAGGPVGQGAEHIVGFEARSQAEGQVEGFGQEALQIAQILEEVCRRLIAMGLVVDILDVPEGGLGGVEGDHHPLGVEAFAVLQQGLEEAIGDAGGHARLGAEAAIASLAEGIETAEGQGMAIHQQQQGLLFHHDFAVTQPLRSAQPARAGQLQPFAPSWGQRFAVVAPR